MISAHVVSIIGDVVGVFFIAIKEGVKDVEI
jgi:hypothetical protein